MEQKKKKKQCYLLENVPLFEYVEWGFQKLFSFSFGIFFFFDEIDALYFDNYKNRRMMSVL